MISFYETVWFLCCLHVWKRFKHEPKVNGQLQDKATSMPRCYRSITATLYATVNVALAHTWADTFLPKHATNIRKFHSLNCQHISNLFTGLLINLYEIHVECIHLCFCGKKIKIEVCNVQILLCFSSCTWVMYVRMGSALLYYSAYIYTGLGRVLALV